MGDVCVSGWWWLAFCLAYSTLSLAGWRTSYFLGKRHGRGLALDEFEAAREEEIRQAQVAAMQAYERSKLQ